MTAQDIKILGVTVTYNNEDKIPYVMPYYERMGIDKLVVYDNGSTDKTVELLSKYPFVEIRSYHTDQYREDCVTEDIVTDNCIIQGVLIFKMSSGANIIGVFPHILTRFSTPKEILEKYYMKKCVKVGLCSSKQGLISLVDTFHQQTTANLSTKMLAVGHCGLLTMAL